MSKKKDPQVLEKKFPKTKKNISSEITENETLEKRRTSLPLVFEYTEEETKTAHDSYARECTKANSRKKKSV